ncbi:MAG: hypothetical protein HGA65_05945 [Oscillochloris sp.]|nr:hypothetical protein [Oscillochloris sp.]
MAAGSGEVADVTGATQLSPAGSLKPWPLIATSISYGGSDITVSNAGVTALGTRIYVIGGSQKVGETQVDYSDNIYWADVNPETGSLVGDAGSYWKYAQLPTSKVIYDNAAIYSNEGYPDLMTCGQSTASGRKRHNVVSLATGTNTGYLYVIGGEFQNVSCGYLSTPSVLRGTVNAAGTITWQTLGPVPAFAGAANPIPEYNNTVSATRYRGVDSASSVIAEYHDSSGVTHYYLYVIGGKSRYTSGEENLIFPENPKENVSKEVYYTEINSSTGALEHPDDIDTTNGTSNTSDDLSVWKRETDDIQFHALPADDPLYSTSPTPPALWEATASATAVMQEDNSFKSAIFLSGGSHNLARTSIENYIYRADVGNKGDLDWGSSATNTLGSKEVIMTGRMNMNSIAYNNKLYLIAGQTDNTDSTAKTSVPTIFLDNNLDAITINSDISSSPVIGETDSVLGSDTVSDANKRYAAGVALVEAQPPEDYQGDSELNSAWAFVIGGVNNNGVKTNTLYQGKIGGAEALTTSYTPDGWYYSKVFETSYVFGSSSGNQYVDSRLVAFHWAIDVDRNTNPLADVLMYFRMKNTLDGRCTSSTVFSDSDAWIGPLNVDSSEALYSKAPVNGDLYNSAPIKGVYNEDKIIGNCIQYRAQLIRGSNRTVTPKLMSVYMEKEIIGNADLNIPSAGFEVTKTSDNQLSDLVIRVQNLNTENASQTISVPQARVANGGEADGDFFVNLCLARSDLNQAAPTLVLPNPATFTEADKTVCRYYAKIHTTLLDAKTILDLTGSSTAYWGWYDNANSNQSVSDIKSVFTTPGHYEIGLILDTMNYIPESDLGETNNQSTIFSFDVTKFVVSLPMINK